MAINIALFVAIAIAIVAAIAIAKSVAIAIAIRSRFYIQNILVFPEGVG